jgi:hypothetical protein
MTISDTTKINLSPDELYEKYINNCHSNFRSSAQARDLNEVAVWRVRGESTENGSGAVIGLYQGKLEHVIRYAVIQPHFWSYGSGGSIEKLDVKQVDETSVIRFTHLRSEEQRLKNELERIQQRLQEIS